jgi:hypothetical protein
MDPSGWLDRSDDMFALLVPRAFHRDPLLL